MDSFMCTLCSRNYSSSKTFEKHIRRCQDKRKLACPECNKEVLGQVQLDVHIKSHKGVDCNICGDRIPAKSVSAHKAKMHGTKKNSQRFWGLSSMYNPIPISGELKKRYL